MVPTALTYIFIKCHWNIHAMIWLNRYLIVKNWGFNKLEIILQKWFDPNVLFNDQCHKNIVNTHDSFIYLVSGMSYHPDEWWIYIYFITKMSWKLALIRVKFILELLAGPPLIHFWTGKTAQWRTHHHSTDTVVFNFAKSRQDSSLACHTSRGGPG